MQDDITDVPGIRVGHAHDQTGMTGCTIVLCEKGAVGGLDLRGTATGTRQMDALGLLHIVNCVHGVFLAGGSAYGLDAAGGVMGYLEERGIGFSTTYGRIPIVPSAVIYDLSLGDPQARPNREMAYKACGESQVGALPLGSVGVGAGATVGKYHGISRAMKGGVGSASVQGLPGVVVGVLAAVNAYGDVIDPEDGRMVAGVRDATNGLSLIRTSNELRQGAPRQCVAFENTTLIVVATNAKLDKSRATKLAQMAQVGLTRTISPAHSPYDGDVVISLALGEVDSDLAHLGALAEHAVIRSILKAVKKSDGLGKIPAWRDVVSTETTDTPRGLDAAE